MTTKTKSTAKNHEWHIRDERGRKVTQLDPIEMRLLLKHDVIDANTLRKVADEIGSGLEDRIRKALPFLVVGISIIAIALIIQIIVYSLSGNMQRIFSARNIALANVWFFIIVIWTRAKQARFGRIRKIMLKYLRCPHCGYDLRKLPVDSDDGATVCPECGCAWKLNVHTSALCEGDK